MHPQTTVPGIPGLDLPWDDGDAAHLAGRKPFCGVAHSRADTASEIED